jgi:hypothetical protein
MPDPSPSKKGPRVPRQGNLIIPPSDIPESDASPVRRIRSKAKPFKPASWWAYFALVLFSIASYAPIFNSGLLWSQYDKVERSPYQSMDSWTEAWSLDTIRGDDPLTISSYFLEKKLLFDPAQTHHAINLFLHIVAAILLLKVLEALKLPAAFSAAFIFALHPAVFQTIFWSGYRHELVGLVLLLTALYFGVRNRNSRDFLALITISALANLVHPITLLLPLLLGLCIFHQKASLHLKEYNRILPLLCIALFIGVWTQGGRTGLELEFSERMSIYARNLFFYIKEGLLPIQPALFHPFNQEQSYNVGAQNSLLPFLLFAPFYILIAINFRKAWARAFLLGLSAYLLVILYGITQRGAFIDGSHALEDHLHYMALPFLIALVICTAGGLAHKMGASGKFLWSIGFTLFAALQMAITSAFAYQQSDQVQMWQQISEQWPDAWLPKLALIDTIQDSEQESEFLTTSEMIDILVSILEQQPQRIEERQLLARIYRDQEQNNNALREYRRILRDSDPDNDFLREAAAFYEKLDLSWDANNARERIVE